MFIWSKIFCCIFFLHLKVSEYSLNMGPLISNLTIFRHAQCMINVTSHVEHDYQKNNTYEENF